ncbi:hypothetical protein D3C78_18510 [compost metagenome]
MLRSYYEKRVYGHNGIVNFIKTLSNIIDIERRVELSFIHKPYSQLLYPIVLQPRDIVTAQVMGIVISFLLSLMLVWTSPVLATLFVIMVPIIILLPRILISSIKQSQEIKIMMEVPVFLETFQVFLKHSRNTYASLNFAVGSVRILAPYLSAISNNWGIDSEKYIKEMENKFKMDEIMVLGRILRNLTDKNPEETMNYFDFHSNRINAHIQQIEEERINKKPVIQGFIVLLPYVGSLILIMVPFINQILQLL